MEINSGHERPFAHLGQAFSCRVLIEVFGGCALLAACASLIGTRDAGTSKTQ
jgi:hypothetical protein